MSVCLGTSEKKRKLEEESSSSEESLSVEAPKGWTTSERKRSKVTDSRCVPNCQIHNTSTIIPAASSFEIKYHHFNYIQGSKHFDYFRNASDGSEDDEDDEDSDYGAMAEQLEGFLGDDADNDEESHDRPE